MADLERLGDDIHHGYVRHIIEAHKQPQMLLLVAFLVTFVIVRFITHSIRDHRFTRIFRNVSTGGTHLHHLVPGIILVLVSGYLAVSLPPAAPREPLAVPFGIGMALTLDEFALWLHLQDVYWAREGRESVDAVVIAATLIGLGLLGGQFWLDIVHAVSRP